MKTNRTIELIIATDGQTRLETTGFVGSRCKDASRFIEKALGRRIGEQLTPEFYAQANNRNSVNNQQ